jgi:hypothetical protein
MIRLSPSDSSQTIKFIPRYRSATSGLSLKITRDGTSKSETLSVDAIKDGNFMSVSAAFSILKDNATYNIEIKDGSSLWYRDKVYCTDSYDSDAKYTMNDSQYNQNDSGDSSQQYIFV